MPRKCLLPAYEGARFTEVMRTSLGTIWLIGGAEAATLALVVEDYLDHLENHLRLVAPGTAFRNV